MAGQMTIVLRSDPAPFQEGTDAAIKAIRDWETQTGVSADNASQKLEDAIRAVVDLGKQTNRSGDEIEQALRGLGLKAEDAEDAIAAIERETTALGRQGAVDIKRSEDALDDLGRAADDAGDKTGAIKGKTGEVGDGLRDLGDVAKSALGGDLAGAAESAVGALGGIAGAIGGGLAGGAITAAIAGVVGSWVSAWNDAAEKSEERVRTMYENLIADGESFVTADRIQKNLIAQSTEDIATAQQRSRDLAIDEATIRRAMAGDQEALANVVEITAQRRQDELEAVRESGKSLEEQSVAIDGINAKYGTLLDWANAQQREVQKSKDLYQSTQDAIAGLSEAQRAQIDRTANASQTRYEELAARYGKPIKIPIEVDDSSLRNYRPKPVRIPGILDVYVTGNGRRLE